MHATTAFIVPPAPPVLPKVLPSIKLLLGMVRNNLGIWPDYVFESVFNRNTLFGVDSVIINAPAGVRHVLATNVANYVRPAMLPRILRPLLGRGVLVGNQTRTYR
jgi:hypothetical protein